MRGWQAAIWAVLWVLVASGCYGKSRDEAPPPMAGAATESIAQTAPPMRPTAHYPPAPAPSLTPWSHPRRACEVLSQQGFQMGGWVPSVEATPGYDRQCVSDPRASYVDPAYRMTYAAIGGRVQDGEARAFLLRLVGPRPGSNLGAARQEFAGVVLTLAESGWLMKTGQPKEAAALEAAVKAGAPGSWPAGGFGRVEVKQAARASEDLVVAFFHHPDKPTKALEALP
jgi:hypothetical protein